MKKVKEIIGRLTAGSLRLAAFVLALVASGGAWAADYTYSNVDSDSLAVKSDGKFGKSSFSFQLSNPSANAAAADFPASGYVQLTSISISARSDNSYQDATTATLTNNKTTESYVATVTYSDGNDFTAYAPNASWSRKEVLLTFATDGVLVDTTATYTLTFKNSVGNATTFGYSVVTTVASGTQTDDWKPAMRISGRTPSGSMLLSRSYLSDVSFGGEVPDLVVLKDATGFSISGDTVTIPATPIQILMSRSAVTMIATVEGIPSTASVMAGVTVNNNTTYWDACSTRTTTGFQNGAANGYSSSGALSTNNNSGWGVASTETVAAGEHAFAFVYAGSGDYYGTHAYLDGSAVANKEQHNGLTWSGYTIKTLTVGGTKANVTSIPDASASGMTIKAVHIYTSALSPAQIATVTAALNKGWTVDAAGTTLTSATLRELPNHANVQAIGSLAIAADGTYTASGLTEVKVLAGGSFDIGTARPTISGVASTGSLAVAPTGTVSQQIEGYEATVNLTVTGDIDGTVTLSGNTVTPVIEAGTATLTTVVPGNPTYTGDSWWWDYEFNGTVTSIGSDKGGMTTESSSAAVYYNSTELYFQQTPYRGASFSDKSELTAVMYCQPGNYANTVLVGFGSTTQGDQKAIALVTGANPSAGEMKLVLTDGHNGGTGTVTELADLTAVGATTTKHLYAFVMDRITENETTKTRIRVYLDGKVKAIYKHNGTLTLSNGFQIGSLHGGVYPRDGFNTGLSKYSATGDGGTLDFLRVVNGTLTDGAMSALAEAYPYNSEFGKATRAPISSAANWVATDVWTQTVPGQADATQDEPNLDTNVTISKDGASDVSVAINLTQDSYYESLTLAKEAGATGSLKLTSGYGNATSGKLVSAETSVLTDTTVPGGRVHLGVTSIADGITLTVDPFSASGNYTIYNTLTGLGFGEVYESVVISMALLGDGASVVLDSTSLADLTAVGFTAELVYNPDNLSYTFKVTREEATADIAVNVTAGGEVIWSTRGVEVPAPASIPDTYTGTVTVNNASTDPVTIATDFAGGNIDVASGSAIFTGAITTSGTVDVEASLAVGGATAYYSSLADAVTAFGTSEGTLTLLANTASALTLVPGQTLVAGSFTTGGVSVASGYDGYELKNEDGTYTLVDNRTSTWVGAAEGTWSTAANWSTGYVPTQYTTVTFEDGATITLDANVTVAGVEVDGDVAITADAKSLSTSGDVTGDGTLTLSDVCLGNAATTGVEVCADVAVNFTNDSELASSVSEAGVTINGPVTFSGLFKSWNAQHTINGDVTINSGVTFKYGSFLLVNGDATVKGTYTRDSGSSSCIKFCGDVTIEDGNVTVDGWQQGNLDDTTGTTTVVLAGAGASLTDTRSTKIDPDKVSTTVADSYVKVSGNVYSVDAYNTVTISETANVTVTASKTTEIEDGETVTLTIAPATGYYVTGVVVDGVTTATSATSYDITVNADTTVSATVAIYTYTLTVPTVANATFAVTAGGADVTAQGVAGEGNTVYTFDYGTAAVVTYTADSYYSVTDNGSQQFTITANTSAVAPTVVRNTVTVTVPYQVTGATLAGAAVDKTAYEPSGLDPSGIVYYTIPAGSTLTLTWTAAAGYFFDGPNTTTVNVGENDVEVAGSGLAAPYKIVAVLHNEGETPYASVTDGLFGLYYVLNAEGAYLEVTDTTVATPNEYGTNGIGYDAENRVYAKAVATVGAAGYLTVQEAIDEAANEASVVLKANSEEVLTLANGKTVTIYAGTVPYTYTAPVAEDATYKVVAGETVSGATTFTGTDWDTWTLALGTYPNATVTGLPVDVSEGDAVADRTVSFTVTADATYKVTAVKVDGAPLVGNNGTYTYTVSGDATVTVETELDVATVTFYAENGTDVIQSGDVTIGQVPTAPVAPTKTATAQYTYTFAGWATTQGGAALETLPAVTASGATYYAVYTATVNNYTVTWVVDGVSTSETLAYGATPTRENPTKAATAQYTYTFTGWSPAIATVTGDATYTAQFSETVNNYTVTWVVDGVSTSETLAYGATPVHAAPTKEATAQYTYTFTGWTPEVVAVTEDATYEAQFSATVNSYAVTFINEGVTVQSGDVEYGVTPAYAGETPTKESTDEYTYTFAGWTPAISAVTGAATYTATYTETRRSYTVTFQNEDGTPLQSSDVEYGTTPAYAGETPTKESTDEYIYTFAGWTPAIASVTGDAIYTATYTETKRSYTVTFTWHGGSAESSVEYGATPTAPADPAKYVENNTIYTFAGWEPAVGSVTGTATYTAQYDSAAAVAKIGDDYYESLADAIAAAQNGDEIVMIAYSTENVLYDVTSSNLKNKTVTISGAKTLTSPNGTFGFYFGDYDGGNRPTTDKLNVSDITMAKSGGNYTTLFDGVTADLTGVTVNGTGNTALSYANGAIGTLVNVIATNTGNHSQPWRNTALALQGIGAGPSVVTVKSGSYTSENGYAVYMFSSGGTVNIEGGTFSGALMAQIDNKSYPGNQAIINISGGTFTNCTLTEQGGANAQIIISGGTFDTNPTNYLADDYVAQNNGDGTYTVRAGNFVAQNVTTGVKYESLADAIAAVAGGDEIVMIADSTENVLYDVTSSNLKNKTVTISGAKTLTSPNGTFGFYFGDYDGGNRPTTDKLNVSDITMAKSGGNYTTLFDGVSADLTNVTVNGDGNTALSYANGAVGTLVNVTATNTGNHSQSWRNTALALQGIGAGPSVVTVKSGSYTSENGYAVYMFSSGGTVNIEGGTFSGALIAQIDNKSYPGNQAIINISGGTFTNCTLTEQGGANAQIIISGGYFSVDPTEYLAVGYEVETLTASATGEDKTAYDRGAIYKVVVSAPEDTVQPDQSATVTPEVDTTGMNEEEAAEAKKEAAEEAVQVEPTEAAVEAINAATENPDTRAEYVEAYTQAFVKEATDNGDGSYTVTVTLDANASVTIGDAVIPVTPTPTTAAMKEDAAELSVPTIPGLVYGVEKCDADGSNPEPVGTPSAATTTAKTVDISDIEPTNAGDTVYFRLTTAASTDVNATKAASQVFGVMKPDVTKKLNIVAVPWKGIGSTDNTIPVSQVIKTSALNQGDELYVYDDVNDRYWVWALANNKTWTAVPTIIVGEFGNATVIEGTPAEDIPVYRGSAFWVKLNKTESKIVLIGEEVAEVEPKQIVAGTSEEPKFQLCASPKATAFNLNAEGAFSGYIEPTGANFAQPGDVIQLTVDSGAPIVFYYKNGQWGRRVDSTWKPGDPGKPVTWSTEATIPVGVGFWYISRGGAPMINW